MEHKLVNNTLLVQRDDDGRECGIEATCECGWKSGPHFSSMSASAAFASHSNNSEVTSEGRNKVTQLDKSDPNFDAAEAAHRLLEQSGGQIDYRECHMRSLSKCQNEPHCTEAGECVLFPRGLTFKALRAANAARCPMFKNAKGETQHSGRDWSPNDWGIATGGELGEAMNVMKKVRRGDMTLEEARPKLAQEFADVLIYLDMLANACGVDLGEAVMETFNAKSRQLELPLFITETGYVRKQQE
jgi:NTP pyrophosphatase (non-canonical NTP hydrolase)